LQIASRLLGRQAQIAHRGLGGLCRLRQLGGGGADAVLAGAQRRELAVEAPKIKKTRGQHQSQHDFNAERDRAHGLPPSFKTACCEAGEIGRSTRTASAWPMRPTRPSLNSTAPHFSFTRWSGAASSISVSPTLRSSTFFSGWLSSSSTAR